jgi:hypothetical protein
MADPQTSEAVDAEFTERPQPLAVGQPSPLAEHGLFGTSDPQEYIDKATRVATVLAGVVRERRLCKKIGPKEFVEIGGWQLLGGMVKVYCSTEWTRKIENGWEARAVCTDIYGNQLSAGEAQCLTTEAKWRNRDDFQVRSMAQTRSQSKAYRAALGFIMELAGYSSTPREEMNDEEEPAPPAEPITVPSIADMKDEFVASGRPETEWPAFVTVNTGLKSGEKISGSQKVALFQALRKLKPVGG